MFQTWIPWTIFIAAWTAAWSWWTRNRWRLSTLWDMCMPHRQKVSTCQSSLSAKSLYWWEKKCFCISVEATEGRVVRAGISVTWNVLSWSGGHEFLNPGGVELGVRGTFVLSRTWTKNYLLYGMSVCKLARSPLLHLSTFHPRSNIKILLLHMLAHGVFFHF